MICEDHKVLLEKMAARLDRVHDGEGFLVHNRPAEGRVLERAGKEIEGLVASLGVWLWKVLLWDLGDDRRPRVLRCICVETDELA